MEVIAEWSRQAEQPRNRCKRFTITSQSFRLSRPSEIAVLGDFFRLGDDLSTATQNDEKHCLTVP